jgi:hypothetical protein
MLINYEWFIYCEILTNTNFDVHALHIMNSRKNKYIDVIQQPENIQPNGLSLEYKNRFGNSVIMFKKNVHERI